MSPVAQQIIEMVDMLPEAEQNLAYELIKRMVLAWDPDFIKVTVSEKSLILNSRNEIDSGEVIKSSDINWD